MGTEDLKTIGCVAEPVQYRMCIEHRSAEVELFF